MPQAIDQPHNLSTELSAYRRLSQAYDKKVTPPDRFEGSVTPQGNRLLSRGPYGSVKMALERATGDWVVIKSLKGEGLRASSLEVEALQHIDSPYVVKLRAVAAAPMDTRTAGQEKVRMVFTYEPRFLSDALKHGASFTEKQVRDITRGLVAGVDACHRAGFAHGDLVPCNVALMKNGAKVTDLGNARRIREGGDVKDDATRIVDIAQQLLAHIPHSELSTPARRFVGLLDAKPSMTALRWHSWLQLQEPREIGFLSQLTSITDALFAGRKPMRRKHDGDGDACV